MRIRAMPPSDALGVETATLAAATATSADPSEPAPAPVIGRFAPAMALALNGADPTLLPVDFKHSRLAPPRVRRLSRRAMLGISALALTPGWTTRPGVA